MNKIAGYATSHFFVGAIVTLTLGVACFVFKPTGLPIAIGASLVLALAGFNFWRIPNNWIWVFLVLMPGWIAPLYFADNPLSHQVFWVVNALGAGLVTIFVLHGSPGIAKYPETELAILAAIGFLGFALFQLIGEWSWIAACNYGPLYAFTYKTMTS